jgi:hypothetical protein
VTRATTFQSSRAQFYEALEGRRFQINEVAKALESLQNNAFKSNNSELNVHFSPPRNTSILYCSSSEDDRRTLISCISALFPSRLFVVSSSSCEGSTNSGSMYILGGDREEGGTYTEVIDLSQGAGATSSDQLASALRAHLYGGGETLFFVVDASPRREILFPLLKMSSGLLCDSSSLIGYRYLWEGQRIDLTRTIDLSWILLSSVRERIRDAFDGGSDFSSLKEVQVSWNEDLKESERYLLNLVVGWIVDRLHLDILNVGARGFECRVRGTKRMLPLRFVSRRNGAKGECSFIFSDHGITIPFSFCDEIGVGKSRIFSDTEFGKIHEATRRWVISLETHFLVGEAFSNYPAACGHAAIIEDLLKAF